MNNFGGEKLNTTRREFYGKNVQIRILNRGQVDKLTSLTERILNMSTYSSLYYSQTILNIVIFHAHIQRLQTYKKCNKLICCGCLKVYRQVAKSLRILSLCDLGKKRLHHKLKLYQSLKVSLKCMGANCVEFQQLREHSQTFLCVLLAHI